MPGILDILAAAGYPITPADPSASNLPNPALWGALNQPSPLQTMLPNATGQAPAPQDAAAYGSMDVDPSALLQPQAQPSAFPAQPVAPAPSAAPSAFGAGASPFSFAGPGSSAMPAAPAPQPRPAPLVQAAPAAAPAAVAPAMNANAQAEAADPIAVGKNYQMPRIGAADDFEPDDATPAAATPTAGRGTPGAPTAPAPFSFGGVGDAIGDRLSKTARGFLGNLAAGPVGALAGGLGALVTGRETDPSAITAQHANVTAQALLGKGASQADVDAAKNNPELLKALIGQYYGRDKFQVVKTKGDAFGGEQFKVFNQADGTFKDVPGDGSAPAPGSHVIDSSLKGDDYLKQFPPEVQSMVKDYIAGKSVPTGNPRQTNIVKQVASKYGEDMGLPVDDATYFARKQMRTQLSSSAPASLGGQINIGNTAAGHLADLSQKALDLGNVDTGIAPLTAIVNGARGLGTEQAAKMEALKGAAQHYGQEITKFYAGSPGGTAERDRFIESVNGARSPKELAAILDTEAQLMRSRLDALGGQIKGVLGDEGMKQYPVLRPDGEAALATVQANVAKLKGGGAPAGPAGAVSEGATATNPTTGQKITFTGGKWQ